MGTRSISSRVDLPVSPTLHTMSKTYATTARLASANPPQNLHLSSSWRMCFSVGSPGTTPLMPTFICQP